MRQIKDRPPFCVHKGVYSFSNVPTMPEYTVAGYTVVDMSADRLGSLYPLVRAAFPGTSFERWLACGREMIGRGGVLALCGSDNSPFGFLSFEVRPTLKHGRTLRVDDFVVFELGRRGDGRRALLDAVEARARMEGCSILELRSGGRGRGGDRSGKEASTWIDLGFSLEGVLVTKPIESVPAEQGREDRTTALLAEAAP